MIEMLNLCRVPDDDKSCLRTATSRDGRSGTSFSWLWISLQTCVNVPDYLLAHRNTAQVTWL